MTFGCTIGTFFEVFSGPWACTVSLELKRHEFGI